MHTLNRVCKKWDEIICYDCREMKILPTQHEIALEEMEPFRGVIFNNSQFYLPVRNHKIDYIPTAIWSLGSLTSITIGSDGGGFVLKKGIPESMFYLRNLRRLHMHYCGIDRIPDSIGRLTNLETLSLNGNKLTSLPESIGNLTRLDGLLVWGNGLTSLPESIGDLKSLRALYIDRNKLKKLPDSLGKLYNLQDLMMVKCGMDYIPEIVLNMTTLWDLSIDQKQSESIPPELYERIHPIIHVFKHSKP